MGVRRTLTFVSALVAAMALLVTGAVAKDGIGPYIFHGKIWDPKPLPVTPGVGGHALRHPQTVHPRGYRALTHYQTAPKLAWPKGGSRTVALNEKPVKAGSLPLWVASADKAAMPAKRANPAKTLKTNRADGEKVRVQLASRNKALRAGADAGLLVGLGRTKSPNAKVRVVIDYSSVAKAYGGGYGSRLTLTRLPACALTTPEQPACRTRTPLKSTNRATADQLTATTTADSAIAVTSGSRGSQGDYSATSLSPSGTWQTSGTGAYTYSYPIDVPAAVGDTGPSVALSYDSQTVDGETSARNSQASWIGDGWGYQPGFVERTYRPCGSLLDGDGKKILKGSGDECWGGDNASVSFGSHSGRLVPTTSSGAPGETKEFRLEGDDGTVVQELSGAANGLHDGVYFRVLTTDGTAAYFGADHAPTAPGTAGTASSTSGDDTTHAAWGVPVLHPRSSNPCHSDDDGKKSRCDKPEGWRWNLDFVVSPSGSVQRYDYSTETGYYDLGGGQAAATSDKDDTGTLTSYTRGGTLTSISYGYTLDDEQAGRTPAAQVAFTSKQRCQTTSSFTDCSPGNLDDNTAPHWPDVPWDLHCDSTDKTKLPDDATKVPTDVCIVSSPTFWTTTRLDSITTKVHVKDGSTDRLIPVDSYDLGQVYSDAGGAVDPVTGTTVDPKDVGSLQAVMWLQSIKHTGKDTYDNGNSDITLNQVSFTGTEIDNRVDDDSPSAPPLYRPRIANVQTETGESITVEYNQNPCAGKKLDIKAADSNTNSCYPTYWTVPGDSKPIADWFNKTTVHSVAVADLTVAAQYNPDSSKIPAGSEAQVSTYSYSGPAWHRDDSDLTDDQYRTWDQFRGFRNVTVRTGKAPEPVTQLTTTYLQGMDGDYKADGTRRSVNVDATVGGKTVETVTDADQLEGTALQTDTYTASGGTVNASTVSGPFTFTTTAHADRTPWTGWTQEDNPGDSKPATSTLPDLTARRIRSSQSHGYALLADGTWRHTRVDAAYDDQGRVQSVDAHGDVSVAAQEKCTSTDYATPASSAANSMLLAYPSRITTVSGPCGTKPGTGTLLSDKKIYYDGNGSVTDLGAHGTLTLPHVTGTQIATGYGSDGTENWRTTSGIAYDGAGRATDTLDATGKGTHTDYLPKWSSTGGNTNPTSIVSTNQKQWKVTSTLDPLRGLATENVDANNRVTDITYDALGRRTAVWLPGRDKATESADMKFAYSINPGAVPAPGGTITHPGDPTSVTTRTLREDGSYATSISIYDGMLQPRQTQTTADGDSDSGRIISDTFYDSHGWASASYAPYSEPGHGPSTTLYAANENEIPAETTTTYDGQGRATTSTLWHQAVKQWSTSTAFKGADETDTTPPAGGSATAVFTNALGQTVKSVVKNTDATATLKGGSVIPSGTSLTSSSVRLTMQADGNLVLTALNSGKTLWSSATAGNPGAYAQFGTDGNLVVYTASGTSKWSTALAATTGATFQIRADSTVAVVGSDGSSVLWHQGTAGAVPAADATTRYSYTPAGQVDSVSDSAGNNWSYKYDLLGEKTSQTDPDAGTTTFDKYDVLGNLLQTTDPRGQVLSYGYDWNNRRTAEYTGSWSATPDPGKQLTSRLFDTLAKGYPTSSTRYVGGASGKAYTEAVTGYNTAYQPLGATLTIPTADGFPGTEGKDSGTVTYTLASSYTPTTGLLSTTDYKADGGLPAERVGYGYTLQGVLDGFGGDISVSNTPSYLDGTVHDPFGRVLRANYGPVGKELATFAQYDATTGRTTQTSSMVQTSATALDVVNYRYNQAGELTATDDLQNNTTHDTQCFTYDTFQRLTAAWTDTAGITDSGSAPVGAVGGCTTASVQTSTAPVKTKTVGGPAPYWQTYTYDLLGDRTGMVDHDTGGNAVADTTQTTSYPGADGTTAANHPNQAGATTLSNPVAGTATQTPSYTDTSGKNAGNTVSRATKTTGPLTTAFTLTGGGKLCVEETGSGAKVEVSACSSSSTAQKWAIGTDGTVKAGGFCLDTAGNATTSGTGVVADACSTDATQKWRLTATGTLVNAAKSTLCLTDPSASATKGTQLTLTTCGGKGQTWSTIKAGALPAGQTQTFTYDAEGRTATVSTPSGTTDRTSKYLYDADGNLLEQTASVGGTDKTRILYLFGGAEQLTLDVPAKTCTGLRYYTGPDGTTITRSSTGTVTYQVANGQGTATTAVDASTLAVTRRYYDPYGNPRGTTPSAWVAPDENHGFLGKPNDTTTGLNLLGARNYDPTLGRFLTVDPVFEPGDPNQMGGYTYAGDNPASGSDPTGTIKINPDGTQCSGGWKECGPGTGGGGGGTSTNEGTTNTSSGNGSPPPPGNPYACGRFGQCGPTVHYKNDPAKIGLKILLEPFWDAVKCTLGISANGVSNEEACSVAGGLVGGGIAGSEAQGVENGLATDAERAVAGAAEREPAAAAVAAGAEAKALDEATANFDRDLANLKRANAKAQAERAAREADAAAARPSEPDTGSSGTAPAKAGEPGKCSFSPDTPVLMAKGKTKPIGKIRTGDRVEAADQKTGKRAGARTVQHVWINHDHDLLDLTIRTKGGHTATIHTTANHPFWDDTTHTWVPAGELHHGDSLNTPTNQHAYVVATHLTPGTADRWNLTVQELHTYYVVAGATPVLVHNCNIVGDGHLYRGVPKGHLKHADALEGRAVPFGGHSEPWRHIGGDTGSEMTSWTHDVDIATEFADEYGPGGVVMRIPHVDVPNKDVQVHDTDLDGSWFEEEHLLFDVVEAPEISLDGETWFNPRERKG
ncbi:polymorphic toxin-type HINT domain-containing protein [Streptomyces olivochromogenes]|uniref:polymorphic toxin-type HINT domain-containing protein n=1 Tax=Streptomyces olivochromogenes TaxID=1963 RepID=UPI001F41B5FA|nr:polymorphic toxin-type HINT domain-containing protein [Streptomyces olivochromogenes]MCF3129503.1 ricin-type beta-trefoil lectin domain protein [Streptomyces olivochromogenes]